jgi:predicted nuclease with RNAse H fold
MVYQALREQVAREEFVWVEKKKDETVEDSPEHWPQRQWWRICDEIVRSGPAPLLMASYCTTWV